jgi:hypothetical protein
VAREAICAADATTSINDKKTTKGTQGEKKWQVEAHKLLHQSVVRDGSILFSASSA